MSLLKKKRIAFIGLSSPTAYYYHHKNEYSKDNEWNWTPIIESPQGLMTLFDEIWFLHPALCPITMRKLDFVKFVVNDSKLLKIIRSIIDEINNKDLAQIRNNSSFSEVAIDLDSDIGMSNYNTIIKGVYGVEPSRSVPIDNHSRNFDFDGIHAYGNSIDKKNIAIDIIIVQELQKVKNKDIELITNSFSESVFSNSKIASRLTRVSQGVMLSRVPVLQHPDGPETNGIEKIRENKFIIEFRDKIDSIINDYPYEQTQELIVKIEEEYRKYMLESLIEKQSSTKIFHSVIKNLASSLMDSIAPGSSMIKEQLENNRIRKMNWTTFLASLELDKK